MDTTFPYWSKPIADLLKKINSTENGLSHEEALRRIKETKTPPPRSPFVTDLLLLIGQFKSPLILILIFAVILASALGDYTNSFIILGIILLSGLLGFWQERNASRALQKLRAMVQVIATVLRAGTIKDISASEVVPFCWKPMTSM
jgi:P-type Mg2+ transporter